jgi:hypothetical protein
MNDDPERAARGLVLYDWRENFDLSKHPNLVIKLVDDLGLKPKKAWFGFVDKKSRNRIIYKKTKLFDIISEFKDYDGLELCTPINGNYLNVEFSLTYTNTAISKRYHVVMDPEFWPLDKVVRHIEAVAQNMSPVYGFSHVMTNSDVGWFLSGTSTTSMSAEDFKRAHALAGSLGPHGSHDHIKGKLHDIYELNVLSPAHLQHQTFGQTLASWIGAGRRGELVEINSRVFVWLVPEDVRNFVRPEFLRAGLLVSPV